MRLNPILGSVQREDWLQTMVEVKIPVVLRQRVDGARSLQTRPGALRDVLEEVVRTYPTLNDQLLSDDGGLRKFVNVYVNDEDAKYLEGLDTQVKDGDIVAILPAVAGGCH